MRVLLVDDQAIVGEAVRRMLASEKDISYQFCNDPTKAVALANEITPHVILQDLVMPQMDGLKLVEAFRSNPKTAEIPIIVLSSKEDPAVQTEAFALGADDYLIKIPDKFKLIDRIRRCAKVQEPAPAAPARGGTATFVGGATPPPVPAIKLSMEPTLEVQDLSEESFLQSAPKAMLDGYPVPVVGGIPLLHKLGQGGMGAVYYGIHQRLRSEVAVKVLPPQLAENQSEMIDRFYREAQIAARVRSSHIVGVLDVNQEANLFYLVMEFVHGKSAKNCIEAEKQRTQRGLHERIALEICIAATKGLSAAHGEGVVHRDIKPDNIMIPFKRGTQDPSYSDAKLADLGIARQQTGGAGLTLDKITMGTPGYMAPEQAMDAKHAGRTSDVFSMGATLYALLSGHMPFRGDSPMKIVLHTLQAEHAPLRESCPEAKPETVALVNRCLAKAPEQRFPDADALLAALREALAAVESSAAQATLRPGQMNTPQ